MTKQLEKTSAAEEGGLSGATRRALRMIEILARNGQGMHFYDLAEELGIPRSAAHRLLGLLIEEGYVRQDRSHGAYFLTAKIASLGFTYLSSSGITDFIQPVLEQLASRCGELVRMAVLDDNKLTFVAKAQGAQHGLRYDPEAGQEVRFSCSASGHAFLSTMSDTAAIKLVEEQGICLREHYGPAAPETIPELMEYVHKARSLGYAITSQTFSPWMNAIAAPIFSPVKREVLGTLVIAGPLVRFTSERMEEIAPVLLAATDKVSQLSSMSRPLAPPAEGPRGNIFE